jgi:ribonuclease HI
MRRNASQTAATFTSIPGVHEAARLLTPTEAEAAGLPCGSPANHHYALFGDGSVRVYTDGSCVGNGARNAVGGYGVYFEGNVLPPLAMPLLAHDVGGLVTNNRAELMAVVAALFTLVHVTNVRHVDVFVDSLYVKLMIDKYCMPGRTLAVDAKNVDILEMIRGLLDACFKPRSVTLKTHFVRGHTTGRDVASMGNGIADKLAADGRNEALRRLRGGAQRGQM